MKTQSRMLKQKENDIHGYDKRLLQVFRRLEQDVSSENFQLIKKYDQMFVQQSLAKAYRARNLNALLMLTRMMDKNWIDVTKEDIDGLVYAVVQTYSDHKGKETNSTADAKKYAQNYYQRHRSQILEKSFEWRINNPIQYFKNQKRHLEKCGFPLNLDPWKY